MSYAMKHTHGSEERECPIHGLTLFRGTESRGYVYYYCMKCTNGRKKATGKDKQEARLAEGNPLHMDRYCEKHGKMTPHHLARGYYVCMPCRNAMVKRRQDEVKQESVDALGGKCMVCGYDKCIAAMDFHHRDPTEKEARGGNIASVPIKDRAAELEKCVLLCANCHRETHYGLHPHLLIPV
jgi:hypothetical protein